MRTEQLQTDGYINPTGQGWDTDATGVELHDAATMAKDSASGDDAWKAKEVKALPLIMFEALAAVFKKIKEGDEWPLQLLQATVACAPKAEKSTGVKDLRLLAVFSQLLRIYESVCVKKCLRWLSTWAPPGMLGNLPNHEVADTFVEQAVSIEMAHVTDKPLAGARLMRRKRTTWVREHHSQ